MSNLNERSSKNALYIFSTRVQDYLNYRPKYPIAILDILRTECFLTDSAVIADIGSGTGFLAELFLANGNSVFGIEPNLEMRLAAENLLKNYQRFSSVPARAEAIPLRDHCIDFIVVGQAFHWFEPQSTKIEFARILKPNGWVILTYNLVRENSPFLAAYHQFCDAFLEYTGSEKESPDIITPFFGSGNFSEKIIDGVSQHFDLHGLAGRFLSRAAAPEVGTPHYDEMMVALKSVFDRYQQNGKVTLDYDTQVIYGQFEHAHPSVVADPHTVTLPEEMGHAT